MKKHTALTAAFLLGLGEVCNGTQKQFNAQLTPVEQEQTDMLKITRYVNDLVEELSTLQTLNNIKKLSDQNIFFLRYYIQKVTELQMLLAKIKVTSSPQVLQRLKIAIQLKIEEIELLKSQAHHNINDTSIIGL